MRRTVTFLGTRTPTELRKSMPGAGIEPAPRCRKGILSPSRLPFRHPGTFEVENGNPSGAPVSVTTLTRERETGLEPATPTLARLCSTN